MSDYLQRLNEEHKKRMRRLQPQQRSVPPPTYTPTPKLPKPTWERCITLIARTYERKIGRSKTVKTAITAEEIVSDSQNLAIVRARDVAIYLTRMSSRLSTPQIGKVFNRDHSTIVHSLAKVQALIDKSPVAKEEIEKLLAQVRPEVICAEEAVADIRQ